MICRRILLSILASPACALAADAPHAAATPVLGVNAAGVPVGGRLDAALGAGAKEVRMFVLWRDLEPQAKGRFEPGLVQAYTDIVARLAAAGVRPAFVFTAAPAWASGSTSTAAPPRDPADYASALSRFAALPGIAGHHIAYELWNEPDAAAWWAPPDPARYAALVRAAAPALRAADPTAEVVLGPTTGSDHPWLEKLYDNGIAGAFDAAAVHLDTACLVDPPDRFFREGGRISRYSFLGVREVLATLRAHGDDKPVRVTEFGWSSTQLPGGGGPDCRRGRWAGQKPSGVTPEAQAAFLTQGYHCLATEPGVEAATWFTLYDAPSEPVDELRHYGLLTAGGARKPAADAFAAIVAGGDRLTGPCGDFEGPSITIVAPQGGTAYADSLLITASARDATGPRRISFIADGRLIRNFTQNLANDRPVSIDWQGAKRLGLGPHRIEVVAVDAQGNETRQAVDVRKVMPRELLAAGPVRFALRPVRCRRSGVCTAGGSLGNPVSSSLPGKVDVVWQWRAGTGGVWRTLHRWTEPAGRPFTFRQRLARTGTWRVGFRYRPPRPLRATMSPWTPFRVPAARR